MEFSQFRQFEGVMFHTITDRHGGVSQKPYDSLNLALHVGDVPLDVLENRVRVSEKYDFSIKNLIYMNQVHGCKVAVVEDAMNNKYEETDAMICNEANIPLMVMVADCIPILLYDPVKNAIGVAHAGRNGTFLGIVQKTIHKMQTRYGCDVKDIMIGLGPSIQHCCYEVGKDLADICTKNFGEGFIMIREGKYFLDLQALNLSQMLEVGILKENIEISPTCTACDTNYFSYRREGDTGRFAGFIMIV
jgi:YfiH family protein